jgi:hypothetical protein
MSANLKKAAHHAAYKIAEKKLKLWFAIVY